jgi:hypothetical protein
MAVIMKRFRTRPTVGDNAGAFVIGQHKDHHGGQSEQNGPDPGIYRIGSQARSDPLLIHDDQVDGQCGGLEDPGDIQGFFRGEAADPHGAAGDFLADRRIGPDLAVHDDGQAVVHVGGGKLLEQSRSFVIKAEGGCGPAGQRIAGGAGFFDVLPVQDVAAVLAGDDVADHVVDVVFVFLNEGPDCGARRDELGNIVELRDPSRY